MNKTALIALVTLLGFNPSAYATSLNDLQMSEPKSVCNPLFEVSYLRSLDVLKPLDNLFCKPINSFDANKNAGKSNSVDDTLSKFGYHFALLNPLFPFDDLQNNTLISDFALANTEYDENVAAYFDLQSNRMVFSSYQEFSAIRGMSMTSSTNVPYSVTNSLVAICLLGIGTFLKKSD